MQLQAGATVRLRAYGGEVIERRVVAIHESSVAVCTEAEYEAARVAGRPPVAVGFHLTAVVSGDDEL